MAAKEVINQQITVQEWVDYSPSMLIPILRIFLRSIRTWKKLCRML